MIREEMKERLKKSPWPEGLTWDTKDLGFLLSECERLEAELEHYKSHYEATLANWNLSLDKVKELEERIQLAEATRDDALAYVKGCKENIKELEEELGRIRRTQDYYIGEVKNG